MAKPDFSKKKKKFKRGCVIGNTEIDKKGDSPVFDFFPMLPPMK
jgi:hypothetical protein